ncbi:MAG TPA: TerC/Alx family metal homeostasis membrane protein [Edaphocola sp.]|nr:TerC/Alx family metal homeostasis membrane protein [Edaphocola sp.]
MWVWIFFVALISICVIVDLGVFNKEAHIIKPKEATTFTIIWVSLALAFSGVIWWLFKAELVPNHTNISPNTAVIDYITGYLVELSLSIDNIFVISVIFTSFKIPAKHQHRVLVWGIIGAMVFRAIMIFFGVALIHQFEWIIYVFGVFLLYAAFNMIKGNKKTDPRDSWFYKTLTKFLPVTDQIDGQKFFITKNSKKYATPLLIALIIIELTDLMFAIDSIPAILAITQDEFIVFSSNIFAILGLRSLYFLVIGLLVKFKFINYSLMVILAFVGLKMLLIEFVEIPSWASLVVIALALSGGIIASNRYAKQMN